VVAGIGGEIQFYKMVEKLEDMVLNKTMQEIVSPIENHQWDEIKQKAHVIKGASSYIGACHLHYVGFYIQDHYYKKKYQKMIDYYPSLVEAAIEYKKYSKVILA
jgi:HPt (histidine-containing phosphotransfer) domain-containing protein